MTITTNPVRNEYTATAAQTVFNYTFRIYNTDEINVYITPAGQDANDATDIISAYTVTGVDNVAGGTIVLDSGATAGDLITIVSAIPEDRETNYVNNGDFMPETVNADIDRTVSLVKQKISRGAFFPDSAQGIVQGLFPTPVNNKLLAWDGVKGKIKNKDVTAGTGIAVSDDGTNIAISAIGDSTGFDGNIYTNLSVALAADGDLGDIVRSAEYYASSGYGGAMYKIVAVDPGYLGTVNHAKTDGSGYYLEMIIDGDLSVLACGIVVDGTTDNYTALQDVINFTATEGININFPSGVMRSSDDLYFCYDATNNTGYPSGSLLGGRRKIAGKGKMSRRDYANDTYIGSVLKFDTGKRAIFSTTSQRSWHKVLEDFSIIGDNPNLVNDPFVGSGYCHQRLFIGNEGAVNGTATYYISDNYLGKLSNIEIIGDKTLTTQTSTANYLGTGLHVDPSDTAGGGNIYENINCAYFNEPLVFGNDYDAGRTSITDNSKGNEVISCQGHYGNVGIHFKQNCSGFVVLGSWGEECLVAPIQASNGAAHIDIIAPVVRYSSSVDYTSSGRADLGLVKLGDTTGTATTDACRNITVRQGQLFCIADVGGIFVSDEAKDILLEDNAFHDGGGYAVNIEGSIGGEITMRGNDYFPDTASSEIVAARRMVSVTGSGTSTDKAYYGLELDFKSAPLAADLNCSTWRRPPKLIPFNTLSATRTLTLPELGTAGSPLVDGLDVRCTVYKPNASNTITIDGQTSTIKGATTLGLTAAYSAISIIHAGTNSNRWDVLSDA